MGDDEEMYEGYLDGFRDDRDELYASNRSAAYQHGWRNGRDDRKRSPRAYAQELREAAALIKAQHPPDP